MRPLLQRLHVYAGLQTCVGILVYGLTAVAASCEPGPAGFRAAPEREERSLSLRAPAGTEPEAVAQAVADELAFPMAQGPWEVHERGGVVSMAFGSPNAHRTVDYNRATGVATIESDPTTLATFVIRMHQARLRSAQSSLQVMWACFNMASAAALLFMVVTGLYLFATAKSRPWYTWAAFATGAATLIPLILLLK